MKTLGSYSCVYTMWLYSIEPIHSSPLDRFPSCLTTHTTLPITPGHNPTPCMNQTRERENGSDRKEITLGLQDPLYIWRGLGEGKKVIDREEGQPARGKQIDGWQGTAEVKDRRTGRIYYDSFMLSILYVFHPYYLLFVVWASVKREREEERERRSDCFLYSEVSRGEGTNSQLGKKMINQVKKVLTRALNSWELSTSTASLRTFPREN